MAFNPPCLRVARGGRRNHASASAAGTMLLLVTPCSGFVAVHPNLPAKLAEPRWTRLRAVGPDSREDTSGEQAGRWRQEASNLLKQANSLRVEAVQQQAELEDAKAAVQRARMLKMFRLHGGAGVASSGGERCKSLKTADVIAAMLGGARTESALAAVREFARLLDKSPPLLAQLQEVDNRRLGTSYVSYSDRVERLLASTVQAQDAAGFVLAFEELVLDTNPSSALGIYQRLAHAWGLADAPRQVDATKGDGTALLVRYANSYGKGKVRLVLHAGGTAAAAAAAAAAASNIDSKNPSRVNANGSATSSTVTANPAQKKAERADAIFLERFRRRRLRARQPPPLEHSALEVLREHVFGEDTFAIKTEREMNNVLLLRGSFRRHPTAALQEMRVRMEQLGLDKHLFFFVVADKPSVSLAVEANQNGGSSELTVRQQSRPPIFIVVSALTRPDPPDGGALTCSGVWAAGTALAALGPYALNPTAQAAVLFGQWGELLLAVAPLLAALAALQAVHDFGHLLGSGRVNFQEGRHWLVQLAEMKDRALGVESYPRNRAALCDTALFGPSLGGAFSFVMLLAGLVLTSQADTSLLEAFPRLPSCLLQHNLLLGGITNAFLPHYMVPPDPSTATVALHPLAVAGVFGVMGNALQLLPFGDTDGAVAAKSSFGAVAVALMWFATIALALVVRTHEAGDAIGPLMALAFVLFHGEAQTCANDVEPVGVKRAVLVTVAELTAILALLPFP